MARARVVIVGAGFGGLQCAQALDRSSLDVLLLDRHNYHLFTPLLYQVASALLNPSDIAYPIRKVFRGSPNVRFRQTEVVGLDREARVVHAADGSRIEYDYLVLATGSATHFFGQTAIEQQSLGLKTLGEALQLRNHILDCLERACREPDLDEQAARMTFVVVGGGPTGVEFSGALAELMRLVVAKEYPQIRVEPRIVLLEGREHLLGFLHEKLSRYTESRLERLGVQVRTATLLESMDGAELTLRGGEQIRSHTVVWSAGVKPATLSDDDGLARTERSRRLRVDDHLRVAGDSRVFAIGDVAGALHEGSELPMMSPPAMQQGRYVAAHILQHVASEPGKADNMAPFRYLDKGAMATIGRNAAVCAFGSLKLTGFLGWLGWLVVHIYYLIGFRNRLVVLWTWCWNYLWYDRPVRIITQAATRRAIAPSGANDS